LIFLQAVPRRFGRVLAHAVRWHLDDRVLVDTARTVVFE
jgi:formyltetrahydrofolate hydrolase